MMEKTFFLILTLIPPLSFLQSSLQHMYTHFIRIFRVLLA